VVKHDSGILRKYKEESVGIENDIRDLTNRTAKCLEDMDRKKADKDFVSADGEYGPCGVDADIHSVVKLLLEHLKLDLIDTATGLEFRDKK